MTTSNLSPAQRIVSHENKISENIQQIKTNEQLIETQEAEHINLLAEKTTLDASSPTFKERVMFDDRLKREQAAKKLAVDDSVIATSELKQDTYVLKLETLGEKSQLKQAQLDEQALLQKNITDTEESIKSSEDRINRLENYNEIDPEKSAVQTEKIKKEQAELANKEKNLADSKESATKAKEASQARDAKVADEIKESCPIQCYATNMALKSNNPNRAFQLATELNSSVQTLQVISLSQAGVKKAGGKQKGKTPPVSIISVALIGACEKGKPSIAAASSDDKKLERLSENQYCPIVKIEKSPINIAMPGNANSPLNFQAFCKSPPDSLLNWGYLFKNILMPSKREPIIYTLQTQGCDSSYPITAQVAAYPKVKAELGVAISYKPTKAFVQFPSCGEYPKTSEIKTDYIKGTSTVEHGNWVFNLSLKGSVDTLNLESQLEHLAPNELFKDVRQALDSFFYIFDIIKLCCNEGLGSNIFKDDRILKALQVSILMEKNQVAPQVT